MFISNYNSQKVNVTALLFILCWLCGLGYCFTCFAKVETTISALTAPQQVVSHLQHYHQLPHYYVTKREARRAGWDPYTGNLCEVLPGKAIGGDRFMDRAHQLPQAASRRWYEADVNYRCGRRGGQRLLYSNDGLIYITWDHYKHFYRWDAQP